jgi:hypothetical protein
MNETQLILEALNCSAMAAPKRTRRFIREIEPLPAIMDTRGDAIARMSRQKTNQDAYKRKPVGKWSSSDFLRYFDDVLKIQDMRYERTSIVKDRNDMGRIYDKIAERILAKMNNGVLKEYLEWWFEANARRYRDEGRPIRIAALCDQDTIARFVTNRFNDDINRPVEKVHDTALSDEELFALGLSMLLMHKGIVVAYRMLSQKRVPNVLVSIQKALRDFNRDVLMATIKRTIAGAPYSEKDVIDFMTVAKPALQYHNISDFDRLSYRSFFKE